MALRVLLVDDYASSLGGADISVLEVTEYRNGL